MNKCIGKKCPMCPGSCQFKDGSECHLPDAIYLRREPWWRRLMWWIQRRQTDIRIKMIHELGGEKPLRAPTVDGYYGSTKGSEE